MFHAHRMRMQVICGIVALMVLVSGLLIERSVPTSRSPLSPFNSFAHRENEENEAEWPKAVPGGGSHDESAEIDERGERGWAHLTYPTGVLPSDWRTRAREHVQRRVADGDWQADVLNGTKGGTTRSDTDAVQPVSTSSWTKLGPAPIDNNAASSGYKYGLVTGRINALAIDPANEAVAYAGAAAGGLWKTTTCCSATTTWTPLWDGKDFVTQSVGSIKIDPNNANVVYVGTGDFDARDQFGVGIMKTTDAGATWTLLGGGTNGIFTPYNTVAVGPTGANPAPTQNIGVIEVDPRNSNTVFAGTTFGLFMSRDAGATWSQVNVATLTQAQRVSSIVLDSSTNPTTMYVGLGYPYTTSRLAGVTGYLNGVYKTTIPASGAPTFSLISTATNGWPTSTGSCTTGCTVGRIRLAKSSQNSQLLYAQVSDYANTNALGTWVTTNGGTTWAKLTGSIDSSYKNCSNQSTSEGQDWYDLFLGVDPTNDKTLYIGRTSLYKAVVNSTYTGFSTLTDLANVYSQSCAGYGSIHPDNHAVAMRSNGSFLVGNDGGVYLGTGAVGSFTALNKSFDTIQFYAGQIGANFGTTGRPGDGKQYAFGGAQDNGNEGWTSDNTDLKWQARGNGGDGFFTAFDPIKGTLTAGNWYTEYTYGSLACSSTGASGSYGSSCQPTYGATERKDWSTPFTLDQHHCTTTNCANLILGTSVVWATGSSGMSAAAWKKTSADLTKGTGAGAAHTILDVRFAYNNPATAAIGTDDGNVQWSNNIYTGTSCTQAAANTASFACTPNTTATWVNLTQSNAVLPNRTILGVGINAGNSQIVYAAVGGFNINTPTTPGHVFQASCAASCTTASNWTWTNKTGNLPDVPAASVLSNPKNPNQVFVGTHFGFYYTNDISVASPVWQRFQVGLPNTVIQYLTVDRGLTTLAAFTFGRGLYTAALPATGGFGSAPTATPVGPTPTNTVVVPTATATNTPVGPTATRTNTPVPPTATNTPVPPTATSTPVVGTEKIVNGGFESGTTPWLETSTGGYQSVSTTRPRTGLYSSYLGGYNSGTDRIYQQITVPTNGTLTYWWYMTTQETTHAYDYLRVRVYNTSGTLLATLRTWSDGSTANAWSQDTISLSTYAGQTVNISFDVTNDSTLSTSFFIDDVSVK